LEGIGVVDARPAILERPTLAEQRIGADEGKARGRSPVSSDIHNWRLICTITITLPDDRLLKLKERATRLSVSPEELVRVSIEELLSRPDEAFQRAVNYVLEKNAELYRRLA
jgi:hypothetical protein